MARPTISAGDTRIDNGEWHMGPSTARRAWLEFHLFGKQGEMERSVTAEEFFAAATRAADAG